jgi:putative peptidoglycan lipid II flippase
VNIALAALLSGPYNGSGIAFALTLASTVNTALLLVFLKKNPNIAVGRAFKSAALYTLKLIVLSCIAIVPILLIAPKVSGLFAGKGRILGFGLPLALNVVLYGIIGIALLLLTKDKQVAAIIRIARKN